MQPVCLDSGHGSGTEFDSIPNTSVIVNDEGFVYSQGSFRRNGSWEGYANVHCGTTAL
jgi:hypothetical protein